jgi:hypothetical protein
MSQENVKIVRDALAAFNRRDLDAWLEYLADDIDYRAVEGAFKLPAQHQRSRSSAFGQCPKSTDIHRYIPTSGAYRELVIGEMSGSSKPRTGSSGNAEAISDPCSTARLRPKFRTCSWGSAESRRPSSDKGPSSFRPPTARGTGAHHRHRALRGPHRPARARPDGGPRRSIGPRERREDRNVQSHDPFTSASR